MLKSIRIQYLFRLLLLWLSVNAVIRVILLAQIGTAELNGLVLAGIFGAGLLNDLPIFCLLTLPVAALILLPGARAGKRVLTALAVFLFFLCAALFLFDMASETLFWQEFTARYNFIAVDYLIYTGEVIGNILESYPVVPMLSGVFLFALALTWLLLRPLRRCPPEALAPRRLVFLVWPLLAGLCLFSSPLPVNTNTISRELSANGVWSLIVAFRDNQLDYRQFYVTMDDAEAWPLLRAQLTESSSSFVSAEAQEWRREIRHSGPEKKLNVIQIVVESLSASFVTPERMPFLASLQEQSLHFTNIKATGTRTVRGIEALTLSLPPTPGASIVRRPNNDGLFTIGSVFRQKGYDTAFLYGGYGYFDNMNAFFSGNGFRVVDRAVIDSQDKTFGNIWGLCDEDLLNTVLRQADNDYAAGRPFYHFALTTSNHRPYTYPEGKVSIPSGTSRKGALLYTDYALRRFMEAAAARPWFRDTVFVIVADHTAGSAGYTDLPPERYSIPCLIYSPAHITPRAVDGLCSQIDIPPTLFALLGWSYHSGFFGRNILNMKPNEGRAWLGTYQLLGYMTEDDLVVLAPQKHPLFQTLTNGSLPPSAGNATREIPAGTLSTSVAGPAVATYQTAHDIFSRRLMLEHRVQPLP